MHRELSNDEQNLPDIVDNASDRCVFKDEHYFMKRFKNHFGCTVKEHFKKSREYEYNVYKRKPKGEME